MQIKGFWHCYLINSWYTIITDQLRILLTSGLYDACEEISIGCIGSPTDKLFLEMFFINLYPKLKIKYHSVKAEDYEFPTLQMIEADNSEYAGFYFHTKAVTRPFDVMQNHWRAYLNEMIIYRWREHRDRIENGYDVSSVNFMKSPDHFSGNFWWFNRRYIDRLPKIDTLDHSYRWGAEQWICKSKGKFYYPAEFFDYSKDTFLMQHK